MSWNKGFTKETHPSVMKISRTMKRKKIDNFYHWREEMKRIGRIPSNYIPLERSKELAELIGVMLGDGNISKFPRTERIIISCNSNNPGFIKHYAKLIKILFQKSPTISKVPNKNNVRISLYQKEISKRLGIVSGSRKHIRNKIPSWIWANEEYLIKFLKGLFEAEGSLSIHKPTYTYNFAFTNKNKNLLKIVRRSLVKLGYHPEVRPYRIGLRKKREVESFEKLIKFREY